jgi:hypothetical protein
MKDSNLEQTRAEARNAFWRAGVVGLRRLIENAPAAWSGSEARFYRSEKELIVEHASPIYWGAVVSGFLFLTFRVSGSRGFIRFREHYLRRHHESAPSSTPTARAENVQWKSYLDTQAETKQELIQRSLSLSTDLLISLMCGCSTAMILADTVKLQRDFVRAPLLPGKSLVDEYLCQEIVQAYDAFDSKAFHERKEPLLLTFHAFVTNCKTRSGFVDRRRKFGDDRPEVIPYPGLLGMTR